MVNIKGIAVVGILLSIHVVHAYTVQKDIIYDVVNGYSLKMDIYRSSVAGTAPQPILIFTHGGCFSAGSKDGISENVKKMADDGIAVFSVGYRLSTTAAYPAAVTDVQQAIRYIRKNATSLNVNPNLIASHGESAGGYLASVLGLRPMADRKGIIDSHSGRIQFVSDWFGRVDFTRTQTTGHDCAESFLGVKRSAATMSRFIEASLLPYVDSKSAQFHIMHGTHDPQVDPMHSTLLANTLWNKGRSATLTLSEGDGHALTGAAPWKLTRKFLLNAFKIADTKPVSVAYDKSLEQSVNAGLAPGAPDVGRFKGDRFFIGGFQHSYPVTPTSNTSAPQLYNDIRAGTNFSYAVPQPQGVYRINMYFAEKHSAITAAGQRLFDISIQIPTSTTNAQMITQAVIPSLDIYSLAGRHVVLRRQVNVISKTGKVQVNFKSIKGNGVISAFEVVPVSY